jgi:hypothetical protein
MLVCSESGTGRGARKWCVAALGFFFHLALWHGGDDRRACNHGYEGERYEKFMHGRLLTKLIMIQTRIHESCKVDATCR